MKTPEGRVKADITAYLDEIGAWYCMPVTGGWGRRLVDFLVCYRGRMIVIETKRRGKHARAYQERVLDQVRAAGGYGFSVDSVDLLRELMDYVVRPSS